MHKAGVRTQVPRPMRAADVPRTQRGNKVNHQGCGRQGVRS